MQQYEYIEEDEVLLKTLKAGGVVVMPTDTLYGVVGNALDVSVINRIYSLRQRSPEKPCIILIGTIDELEKFSITLSEQQKNIIKTHWPGPVSIIFDCSNSELIYLHRGTNTLAFRLPAHTVLREVLKKTGPLVAPSANPEGSLPAKNIDEAKKYFGDTVDLYIDDGEIIGQASKVIRLYKDGSMSIIRA